MYIHTYMKLHIESQDIELCPTSSKLYQKIGTHFMTYIYLHVQYMYMYCTVHVHVLYSTCAMYMYELQNNTV